MSEGREDSLAVGDTVRITRGVFKNRVGRIDGLDATNRSALLKIHGLPSRVKLGIERLERITKNEGI
jgi:transcription antitermination factor NusG